MNRDDIVRMAQEANLVMYDYDHPSLERFAVLVAAAKCEELAKKIAEMPFGDTAESFAIWVRDQK